MKIKGFNFSNVQLEILPSKKSMDDYSRNTAPISDFKHSDNFLENEYDPFISHELDEERLHRDLEELEKELFPPKPSDKGYYESEYFKMDVERLAQEMVSEGLT